MANIFSTILQRAIKSNVVLNNTTKARNWLVKQTSNINASASSIIRSSAQSDSAFIGSMLLFGYKAKLKDKLPYYDRYPLIFPFKIVPGGFYGINLHYLPPMQRAMLMDNLYEIATTNDSGEKKLQLTYQLLNSISRSNLVKPCVKHYLNIQVQSQFAIIPSDQWEVALFLPIERFVGADKQQVYRDSARRR